MKAPSEGARQFLIVTAVAFALRAVHIWFMRVNPLFDHPIMDAGVHDVWARGILDGTWPGPEPFFRAPLYPYLLAGLYAVFDAARLPVQLVHGLISALGAGLAALCATRLWSRAAGWCAGLLLALLWTSIWYAGELLLVTVPVTLNLLWLWLLVRGDGEIRPRTLALVGLALGLSAIARPNVLIVLPAVAWFLWRERRPRRSGWLMLAAGLALPILPVTVSNLVRGGDTVLIASQGGVNFYIGNNAQSDGRTAIVPGTRPTWQGGFDDAVAKAERAEGRALKPSEVDRHYLKRGLTFWLERPGEALRLYGRKLYMLLGAGERSNNKFIYPWREWSPLLQLPVLAGWPLLLALAVLGWSRRDGGPGARRLLLGTVAAYALSILLFFVNARFRLPVAAILAMPAGAGLAALIATVRGRGWRLGLVGPAVAAVLLAVSLSDLRGFDERRTELNPFYPFTLGNAWAAAGEPTQAIAAYRRALSIQSRTHNLQFDLIRDNLHRSLVDLLTSEGRVEDATQAAGRWVQAAPNHIEARMRYGDLLLATGRVDEAAVQFDIVLRTTPEDPQAQLGSAWVLLRQGDTGAALRRFRNLERIDAGNVQAGFGAGLCLMSMERYEEAEAAFQGVLQRDPGYWQAWGNLADIYQRTGRTDLARRAYREVLRVNPGDQRARSWLAGNP